MWSPPPMAGDTWAGAYSHLEHRERVSGRARGPGGPELTGSCTTVGRLWRGGERGVSCVSLLIGDFASSQLVGRCHLSVTEGETEGTTVTQGSKLPGGVLEGRLQGCASSPGQGRMGEFCRNGRYGEVTGRQ